MVRCRVTAYAGSGEGEDLVAVLEFRDGLADGFNLPGQLNSQYGPSRPPNAENKPGDQAEACGNRETAKAPVRRADGRCMDPDQDFARLRLRLLDIFDFDNAGRPVLRVDCSLHVCPSLLRPRHVAPGYR